MTDAKPRLAIIEDNLDLQEELVFFLKARHYPVWGVNSAEAFWRELHGSPVDIVLIDLGLPGEDGFSVIDYLRQLSEFGLIVLTARGDAQDKLRGLNLGADLYLIKPVNFARLVREIEALWTRMRDTLPKQRPAAPTAANRDWTLDDASSSLTDPEGRTIKLTPQEYAFLKILQRQPGEVYAKSTVHELLFGLNAALDTHRVDVILSRLRKKAAQHKLHLPVRTLFGRGLVFLDTRRD